ncbi:class I SAM-dependent methyltransferase [Fulvivirga sp. 29W222]|uniref:Class I SAM-dependent methyltransferase n=1 Tax=Fulvivirga marina TaxID=2494733 RepID=A0A937FYF8_9BACT|nr:class I SAM-dependent methyltransferase [Fulvivirga marina]MBL6448334.1 class I SAM-dependent methyltransferase [Fulvivirga marina]
MSNYAQRTYEEIIDIKDDKKVKVIKQLIPKDVKTIVDIGCGNGLITNQLAATYDILGVDINPTKLKHVKTKTLESSCNKIELPDKSFDLVFSSELLEHLPEQLLRETLSEFERLSKKYILITVPNKESLIKLMVKCDSCKKLYHKNGHLHSFDFKTLDVMFTDFRILEKMEFGPLIRAYNNILGKTKHALTPASSWIPKFWSKKQGISYTYCLHCGKKNETKHRFHPIAFGLDMINLALSKKNKSQLIALFERKSGE